MTTLADLAMQLRREPPREQTIREMVAFLGRYGRQPATVVLFGMTANFAIGLMGDIAKLIREEREHDGG